MAAAAAETSRLITITPSQQIARAIDTHDVKTVQTLLAPSSPRDFFIEKAATLLIFRLNTAHAKVVIDLLNSCEPHTLGKANSKAKEVRVSNLFRSFVRANGASSDNKKQAFEVVKTLLLHFNDCFDRVKGTLTYTMTGITLKSCTDEGRINPYTYPQEWAICLGNLELFRLLEKMDLIYSVFFYDPFRRLENKYDGHVLPFSAYSPERDEKYPLTLSAREAFAKAIHTHIPFGAEADTLRYEPRKSPFSYTLTKWLTSSLASNLREVDVKRPYRLQLFDIEEIELMLASGVKFDQHADRFKCLFPSSSDLCKEEVTGLYTFADQVVELTAMFALRNTPSTWSDTDFTLFKDKVLQQLFELNQISTNRFLEALKTTPIFHPFKHEVIDYLEEENRKAREWTNYFDPGLFDTKMASTKTPSDFGLRKRRFLSTKSAGIKSGHTTVSKKDD